MENNKNSHKIKSEILSFIKKVKVASTTEVADKFSLSWNTAEKYLLELALKGAIQRLKKAGVNLWVIK